MCVIGQYSQNIPFWRQIRWNLILYFLLLAVLPMSIVVAITISQTSGQARQQVIAHYETVAELRRDQIESWLQDGQLTLALILADTTRQDSFSSLLEDTTVYNPELQEAANTILSEALAAQSIFDEFFLYDGNGRIMASSHSAHIGRVIARQPYFAPSLEGHYVQPPFYETARSEKPTMFITHSIGDTGALAGRLSLDTLSAIMTDSIGLGDTGETYLIAAADHRLLTPGRLADSLDQSFHSEGIDSAVAGENGASVYANHRTPPATVIGVYLWIPELNAALLAEIEEAAALSSFVQARDTSAALAGVAGLVAIVLGFYSAGRLSQPIAALTRVAGSIASGDLSQRADIQHDNEIGLLASAFNQMTDHLARNIHELREATLLAQESARLKSEFINTMSHELRTPLNAILGFSGIMLEGMGGEIDDEARHMLERIDSNSNRLLNLINEILDLAKIESGRMELVSVPVYPRRLAEQWQSQMQVLAQQKGLDFEFSVDPALPEMVIADPERITQIGANLLSNAFKFTEQGSVKLELECNDSEWIIRVTDTGVGIPPHAIDYIFDEFRQADGSYMRAYGGTGLGLAIVRSLCRMMNGSVRCTSELGEGSVFTVTLPLITQSEPQVAA
jgi:signal transduction histidine kinase